MNLLEKVYAAGVDPNIEDPLGGNINSISKVFGVATNILLGVGWALVFVAATLAIIKYINSKGDPKETNTAHTWLLYCGIGAFIMFAFTTIRLIIPRMLGATWTGVPGVTDF
ncbi:hypothetical protein A3F07_01205 [candidate division WWE3 bacterium RIFCSPHIGHO2_12_FULL_38_15]|uniref:DUF5671 domain-containing protein n=1 Tax=candidate division WWE3 bacterium RIFCSPHIGHO2_02_FULL_38_14 TaxID=1802620 RepID=A0A1F4V982_UNCKA|nr:MAG: hypothetical protein A2793_02090 [candidate division WWE3 bacterium RIFCSPHIGHO2_01_FULL_38_45]OGC48326.1 MAG: hypothetical protein A3F07_01205 [candidate division WWE3 bacterium RIFCSPHIGHO2_12_FULL_38_15]OGC53735.1 MAG: hypothetical protein A3D91_03820 [candidate division WWE3 bacterium RIFCSPHIGHO2_02_FULL_38_14]OGC54261.1 MAG: hypothetical protein A3B64_02005 [candidate division WWE3 bacterium RIFCSPLOWO2_01_FULL_37_24]HLB51504.1 hypothetical protein [Patescibacteria group bacterium